jgi:hypothetical protein
MSEWDEQKRADIYVLALCVVGYVGSWNEQDQEIEMQSVIDLIYNTQSHLENQNAASAKWHSGEWKWSRTTQIPSVPFKAKLNFEELSLRDAWCETQGLIPTGQDEAGVKQYEPTAIYSATFQLCRHVVSKLQDTGALVDLFGKSVPVLITDTEGIIDMDATEAANPPNIFAEVREFLLNSEDGGWLASRPPQ